MAWLRGTPLEHEDEVLLEEKERHARLRETLELGSFEDWLWAKHCYLSRSFEQSAFPRLGNG